MYQSKCLNQLMILDITKDNIFETKVINTPTQSDIVKTGKYPVISISFI